MSGISVDKHAIISGGGTGIGRATAVRFAEEGATVNQLACGQVFKRPHSIFLKCNFRVTRLPSFRRVVAPVGSRQRLPLILGLVTVGLLVVGLYPCPSVLGAESDDGWISLFNGKNLDGWYTFLSEYGKDNDPEQVFTVENGEVHIYKDFEDGSEVPLGYFATPTDYSHYHLRFQYRWGSKRFGIRTNEKRDSGLMYHCTGPDGVLSGIWPRCIECQVQEGDTGDALCLVGARYKTFVDPDIPELPGTVERQYLSPDDGGVPFQASVWVARNEQRDLLTGWNTVDVIVMGNDYAVHVVNGVVNHRITNLQQLDEDSQWVPLIGGRFLFQAELAEVFYRNIKIRPLSTGPFRPQGSALVADQDGVFHLFAHDAALRGASLRFQPDEHNTLGHWHGLDDVATWTISVDRPGTYDFELDWSIDDGAAVNTFQVTSGNSSFAQKVPGTGGWWTYQTKIFGELQLEAGIQEIIIKPVGEFRGALMDFRAARLLPRQ